MSFDLKTLVARFANTFTKSKSLLARSISELIEARRRSVEHEREFYRDLNAYCRAHKMPAVCTDDWMTSRQ